jgi:O-antigen/teichoic acid export membrane protein
MEIYKKFARDVSLIAISELLIRVRPIIFLPIITKVLGASDYGIYTSLLVTLSFLLPFSLLGTNISIVRFLAPEKNKIKKAKSLFTSLYFVCFTSIVFSLFLYFSAGTLANTVFGNPESAEIIRLGAFLFPVEALLVIFVSFFQMKQQMYLVSLINISKALGPLALAILFLLSGYGLMHLIYSFIIVYSTLTFFSLLLVLKDLRPTFPDWSILAGYLSFGIPLVIATFSGTILNLGDRYVIGFFMSSTAVGIYAVAYTIGNIISIFMAPINVAILSPASKAYESSRENELKNYFEYGIKYFLMLAIPAIFALTLLSDSFITALATEEFLNDNFMIVGFVSIAALFYGLFNINATIFYVLKKVKTLTIILIGGAISNIILNILLVPKFGLVGAAFSTLLCFMSIYITSLYISRKHMKISIKPKILLKIILSALIMSLFIIPSNPHGWIQLIPLSLLLGLLYFILLFLTKAFEKKELLFIWNFVKNPRR